MAMGTPDRRRCPRRGRPGWNSSRSAPTARPENSMKNRNTPEHPTTRRFLRIAGAAALAAAFTLSLPPPAHAAHVTPPPVPATMAVEAGNTPFLEGHGVGTQNY